MTGTLLARPWHAEFDKADLADIRAAIPAAIEASQVRSARAQLEYADPDDDQYVYGAGMSRGVVKELEARLEHLPSFHRVTVEGTSRRLTQVGHVVLFPIRIGKTMPRNRSHIRMSYLPDVRRDIFRTASMTKYGETTLQGLDLEEPIADETATQEDLLKHIAGVDPESLIVPYYSSDPHGVGSVYWAPARLVGNYLDFSQPELLTFMAMPTPADSPAAAVTPWSEKAFANGTRPTTPARLRASRRDPQ